MDVVSPPWSLMIICNKNISLFTWNLYLVMIFYNKYIWSRTLFIVSGIYLNKRFSIVWTTKITIEMYWTSLAQQNLLHLTLSGNWRILEVLSPVWSLIHKIAWWVYVIAKCLGQWLYTVEKTFHAYRHLFMLAIPTRAAAHNKYVITKWQLPNEFNWWDECLVTFPRVFAQPHHLE